MIGDRLDNDIAPAKRVGLKTVWIRQGFGGMGDPLTEEQKPDYFVGDLSELFELFTQPVMQPLRGEGKSI